MKKAKRLFLRKNRDFAGYRRDRLYTAAVKSKIGFVKRM